MAKYADDNGLTHLSGLIITWVKGLLSSTNPLMDGTATPGTAKMLAREDHVHPTDTSRAAATHSHGNITSGGDITATAPTIASGDKLIINDESESKVTNGPAFDGSTTSKALSQKGTWESFAAGTHAHGNITSGGDITATAPTVATGDKIIINDESASKVTNGPSFDTSDTAKYLRHDGTWVTPPDSDTEYDIETTGSGSNRKLNLLEDGVQKTQVSIPDTNTTYSDFTGATSSAAGAHGLVPAPAAGEQNDILIGDATWMILNSAAPITINNTIEGVKKTRTIGAIPADGSHDGFMSSAHYTKLEGIAAGAEVNQNAFSNVKVGSTTIAADGKTDTIELVAGENVALTPDATNDKVTIAATDTDTKNTAGSTDSSSKLFIIGATSQAANPQTYSQDTAYVGTNGHLYSNSKQVVNLSDTQALTNKTYNGYTLGAACAKAIGSVADGDSGLVTGDAVYDAIQSALGTMADALVYQGTIGAAADSPTVTSLPATHSKGDVYIVKTAGTYAGKGCEVGDMIICNTDGTTANNAHWDIIQSNIEALTNSEITTIWNNAVTANW